jgi:hypothetical protein
MNQTQNTASWNRQVWISAFVAVCGAAYAIANIPTLAFTKLFLTMAFIFSGVMCFVLAKYIRDRQAKMKQTPSFKYIAYGGTFIAAGMFVYGVREMANQITTGANAWTALVILAWCYLQTTGFALAKTQRDNFENSGSSATEEE